GTATIPTSGVFIACRSNIKNAPGATVWANVEAAGTIGTANYLGTQTSGVAARKMPASNLFDYYTANGTTISLTSLPNWSSTPALNRGVLTPTVNTIGGGTNP